MLRHKILRIVSGRYQVLNEMLTFLLFYSMVSIRTTCWARKQVQLCIWERAHGFGKYQIIT